MPITHVLRYTIPEMGTKAKRDEPKAIQMVNLRPGQAADREAILALMRPGDYNRVNLKPTGFIVAETEGQIVGIGQIKRHRDGTPELASLVVAEPYRQQGIAGRIVQQLVDQHQQAHPTEGLYLFCLAALEHYYQRFGFQTVKRQQLPWPLWSMHLLGNSIGRLVHLAGGPAIHIRAMYHAARANA